LKKEKTLSMEYVDTVLFDIVREFYMQRGEGAKFRTVLVGRKYFEKTLYRKVIVEKDFKKSLANLCKELPRTGIVEGLDIHISRKDVPQYLWQGSLFEAEVKGCVHLQVREGPEGNRPLYLHLSHSQPHHGYPGEGCIFGDRERC